MIRSLLFFLLCWSGRKTRIQTSLDQLVTTISFSYGQDYRANFDTLICIHPVAVIQRLLDPKQMHTWLSWMILDSLQTFLPEISLHRLEISYNSLSCTLLPENKWELLLCTKTKMHILLFPMIFYINKLCKPSYKREIHGLWLING